MLLTYMETTLSLTPQNTNIPQLKRTFLSYLMQQFTALTCRANLPNHVIIDYEDVMCPVNIYRGQLLELPMLANNNGEADYNVWYHCMKSTHSHIIVLGSDTDIWVYGMALMDCGWIENKVVLINKTNYRSKVAAGSLATFGLK